MSFDSAVPVVLEARRLAAIPLFPEFAPIARDHGSEFEEAMSGLLSSECSHITWLGYAGNCVRIAKLYGNVVLRWASLDRSATYTTFVGLHHPAHTAGRLLGAEAGACCELRLIPEPTALSLSPEHFSITADRDHFDYIHDARSLSTLHGGAYESKRRWVHRFCRTHEPRIGSLDISTPAAVGAVIALAARWRRRKQQHGTPQYCSSLWGDEFAAMRQVLLNSDQFESCATGIWSASGELNAFSLAEIVAANGTAIVHFIKADTAAYPGSFETLMQATATAVLNRGCTLLNMGEDLGIPSLREAKRRYRPIMLLKKFTVRRSLPSLPCTQMWDGA